MNRRKGFALPAMLILIYLVVLVFGVLGYACNIYQLCHCDFEAPVRAEVIRCIGIVVPPVGAVAGYIRINDDKPLPQA